MINHDWLLKSWAELSDTLDLPPAIACTVAARPQVYTDVEQLRAAMSSFAPSEGWICCQSRVHVMRERDDLGGDPGQDGLPVSGELVNGARSLVLRTVPEGWRLIEIEEGASTGIPALAFDTCRVGTGDGGVKALAYRVYWLHDAENGFEPRLARFTGYQEK